MKIEDEHSAFLIECCAMMGNAYYPADTGFANGEFCDPSVQRLFVVWRKAKAYAVAQSEEACSALRAECDEYRKQLARDRAFKNKAYEQRDALQSRLDAATELLFEVLQAFHWDPAGGCHNPGLSFIKIWAPRAQIVINPPSGVSGAGGSDGH